MSPDHSQLTAYLFGELSPQEHAALELAVRESPELRAELETLRQTQNDVAKTLVAQKPLALRPHQRAAVLSAAKFADAPARNIVEFPKKKPAWRTWQTGLAAAAAIALGLFFISRIPVSSDKNLAQQSANPSGAWRPLPMKISLQPAAGPVDPNFAQLPRVTGPRISSRPESAQKSPAQLAQNREVLKRIPLPRAVDLPELTPRDSVLAAQFPALPLPVEAGNSSLGWIAQSVRGEGKLPSNNVVRIEEILNSFPLTPVGSAAKFDGISISTETLTCPWKPAATLLLVSIQGAPDRSVEVASSFQADPASVLRYRLIGFANVAGAKSAEMPNILKAGSKMLLAIEIETRGAASSFGSIQLAVDKGEEKTIPLMRNNSAEPSDDSRFAALVCTYGQWLSSDPSGKVDADTLTALTREISTSSLSPDRNDFLALIDQSLKL